MEVKPGYKQTEVGVIPEDWGISRLGDLCQKIQDGTHFSPRIRGGDFLYVTSKNIGFGSLDVSDAERIDAEQHAAIYKRCDVRKNDLLLTKDGANTGNAALNTLSEPFSLLSSVAFLRFDEERHAPGYFLQQILSDTGQRKIKEAMSGNAITRLTLEKINNLQFIAPPVVEQHAIASALSDMDTLLEGMDRLIAKKRAIKRAAMQQLLTGHTRLPGFSGEWEMKLLGDVANIKTGNKNNEDKADEGDYPFFVRSENIERISSYSYDCEAILVPGEGRIGEIFHYISGKFDVHQRVYAITQFSPDVSGRFLHFYLSANFGAWAMQNTVKATVDSLRLPTFLNFKMHVPPTVEEQAAIATVLADMDTEITFLETRRSKTRALKQAMMQELLTGRTRLIELVENPVQEEVLHTEGRKANIHFLRSVLAAEIIDRLHDQPTFGHVKFEKMMFLTEHLCEVDTGSTYHRKAAGPYDNRALRSIDSQLQKQQWFEARKKDGRYQYVPLAKRGGHKPYFERHFYGISEKLEKILGTFKTARTEQCEIVATLLGAWDDLLREGGTVSDEMIVLEVLHNWHEAKQRIPEDRWLSALGWMREEGFVPNGATLP